MYRFFPPVVGDADTLILGTFPSTLSRAAGEYYGNPRNAFWKIIFDLFAGTNRGAPSETTREPDYVEKLRLLRDNGVALWDVIESCEIDGALDKNIKNPVYNAALPDFILRHEIKKVLFNGTAAYKFYRRGIGEINFEHSILPSTSPANASLSYAKKLAAWREALSPDR